MLQINELTISHKKDLRVIVENFDLVLNYGDKAVIIGEEGNGKSTLMKWIYNPELIEGYAEWRGSIARGQERMAYLAQELSTEDQKKTVYEFFAEAEEFFGQTPKELGRYAKDFGVAADFFYREQTMESLSGGEKIKAQLIRILMGEPTVLLLDEPSNDIDIGTLKMLEKLICDWKYIVLFISHDECLIENTANTVIHMEQVRRKTVSRYTVAAMPYMQYVTERQKRIDYQRQQAQSDIRQKKLRDEKYARIYQRVEHELATVSRGAPAVAKNLKDKMHTVKAMGRRFEREDENMTAMPEYEEAIFFKLDGGGGAFPAGKKVIDLELPRLTVCGEGEPRLLACNIRLVVKGPEKICIVGRNGAGKTTLIRRIAEELLGRKDIRAEYMPQNYEELLDMDSTPVEYLDSSGDKERRTLIRTYLGALKYTAEEMSHPIRELSGGQKAKILLLHMSLSGADVLVLDEPTRNFSPLSGPVIRGILKDFPGAIISISHDRKYIGEVCDRVYELTENGLTLKEKEVF